MYKAIIFFISLMLGFLIYEYKLYGSQMATACSEYVDFARPQNNDWNLAPMQSNSFLIWEGKYDKAMVKSLKPIELEGYKVLTADSAIMSYDLYHMRNEIQTQKGDNWITLIYKNIINPDSNITHWWESYYSTFELVNKLPKLDCKNIDYDDWLKLTDFFDIYPFSLPHGFHGLEILRDAEAHKILIIAPIDDPEETLFDGALISLENDNIVTLLVSSKDKNLVRASLVESAKTL